MRLKDLRGRVSYLADAIRTAAANITNNKLRSFLTIGIVCLGITCLVGTQTAIDCLSSLLAGAFGTSAGHISVTAMRARKGGALSRGSAVITYPEAEAFAVRMLSGPDGFEAEGASLSVYTRVPLPEGVGYGGGRLGPQTSVLAFEGDYLGCNGLAIGSGRKAGVNNECLVGKKVAAQVYRKTGSDIGSLLYIGSQAYRIAGVLKEQSSLLGMVTDNTVFVPLAAAMGSMVAETGNYSIDMAVPKERAGEAAARAEVLMRRIRHLPASEKPDFEIVEGSAAEREIDRLGGSLSAVALIIGLLTLLGAAVALTNIMLICVAERTREVGLRRAVGATRTNIRDGFVAEAMLICEAGCIAGTLLGLLCGNAFAAVMHTDVSIPWDWTLVAQVICMATAIIACTLPARRASRINVVDALRCE